MSYKKFENYQLELGNNICFEIITLFQSGKYAFKEYNDVIGMNLPENVIKGIVDSFLDSSLDIVDIIPKYKVEKLFDEETIDKCLINATIQDVYEKRYICSCGSTDFKLITKENIYNTSWFRCSQCKCILGGLSEG